MPVHAAQRLHGDLSRATQRAAAWLGEQARSGFAEAAHEMNFPHSAGFSGTEERQRGDLFVRATLAHLLLDCSAAWSEAEHIARREAEFLAAQRLSHRRGGWSYFPGLPELPPDADSLAAIWSLFLRVAPAHAALCDDAVAAVLAGMGADGSFETWIVDPGDDGYERMQWGIAQCWGRGCDVDVVAHFCHALWLADRQRHEATIRRCVQYLVQHQQPDGAWQATWYAGPAYATGLALRLLDETGLAPAAGSRALAFLLDSQQPDGSWGGGTAAALQTALSLIALSHTRRGHAAMRRGAEALLQRQLADGSWQASPWIRMEIGRASGQVLAIATYKSRSITTAYGLRALLPAADD